MNLATLTIEKSTRYYRPGRFSSSLRRHFDSIVMSVEAKLMFEEIGFACYIYVNCF